MKKAVYSLVGLLMVLGLVFTSAPGMVNASPLVKDSYTPTWVFPLDPATSYETVRVEAAAENAPEWLQLFSAGASLSQPTKICYTFRNAQFHWVPQFLQLKDGAWKALATSVEYLDGEEGKPYACAWSTEAGVYALFAYYSGPAAAKAPGPLGPPTFTVGSWSMTVEERSLKSIAVSTWRDFKDIYANDVNWSGYPSATRLAWGIEMCWNFGANCQSNPDGSVSISKLTYPQNYDVPVFTGSTMGGSEGVPGQCRFAPFVELLDADGKSLNRIYYITEYEDYCIS
jgi:hypothetical protein